MLTPQRVQRKPSSLRAFLYLLERAYVSLLEKGAIGTAEGATRDKLWKRNKDFNDRRLGIIVERRVE